MDISDKHISITSEAAVKEICEHFFKATGISYFHYAVFYKVGYCFSLVSHAKWHKYCFNKRFYNNNVDLPADGCYLFSSFAPNAAVEAKSHFNIDNFFVISKDYTSYYLILGFGVIDSAINMIDFYFNNQDVLRKFGHYFRDKANRLIKISNLKENRIIMPEYKRKEFIMADEPYTQQRKILEQIEPNKYFINDQGYEICLSKRETDCLISFIKCRSAKEMAYKLNISKKTAESYIASAREKLNCASRSELYDKLFESGFTDLLV